MALEPGMSLGNLGPTFVRFVDGFPKKRNKGLGTLNKKTMDFTRKNRANIDMFLLEQPESANI